MSDLPQSFVDLHDLRVTRHVMRREEVDPLFGIHADFCSGVMHGTGHVRVSQ